MNVRELIQRLSDLPPEFEVTFWDHEYGQYIPVGDVQIGQGVWDRRDGAWKERDDGSEAIYGLGDRPVEAPRSDPDFVALMMRSGEGNRGVW